ncbi:SPOR domain-containing protein [Treponema sp.]|uniref:SPOR domain-containing protein n=1 Tax=Treponema sp. TaxID=166 RepID=UPI003F063F70
MKKILSGILILLFSVSLFAEPQGAVEGIIEVAGKDDLPAGYFGKTAGYLPGDSVSITNPKTGITLQILNLGTLDASDGIAVLISEESAKSLGIERNSGVRVKLAPRSGFFDETVSGSAVLDEKTLPAENAPAAAVPAEVVSAEPDVSAAAAPEAPVEAPAVSVAGIPLFDDGDSENAPDEIPDEEPLESAQEAEADFSTEPEPEIVPLQEDSTDDSVIEDIEDYEVMDEPCEENTEPEDSAEPLEDYESVEDGFLESKNAVEQPSPAEESEAEAVLSEELSPVEEEAEAEEFQDEEPACAEEDDELESEEFEAEEVSPVEEESLSVEETSPVEDVSEVEEVEEVKDVEEVEETVSGSDEYAPIILVPSEPEAPTPVEPSKEQVVEIVPVEVSPVQSAVEYPVNIRDYVKASESELSKGCYYVQIATMSSDKNIEKLIVKYSKYPVVLIPAGKNYRVLIGPLSVDEYGAVLARFKDFGFKDAFVKKF